MTGALRSIGRTRKDTDLARVVGALHRSGPISLDQLCDQPDLAQWPVQRVEQAVVEAWEQNLIFVDPGDQLVAL